MLSQPNNLVLLPDNPRYTRSFQSVVYQYCELIAIKIAAQHQVQWINNTEGLSRHLQSVAILERPRDQFTVELPYLERLTSTTLLLRHTCQIKPLDHLY